VDNAAMPGPFALPLLSCAAVLVVSGVAKLRSPGSLERAMESLRVTGPLAGRPVRVLLPWAEVALGVALLVTTGPVLVVVGALVLVLFAAYLAVVAPAVRRPEPADCGCFGALGDTRVTNATVVRNVLLVVAAAATVVGATRGGGLPDLGEGPVAGWLLGAALAAAVAVAVTWRPAGGPVRDAAGVPGAEDDEYVREQVPDAAQVLTADRRLLVLVDEALSAARLLVFLRPGCAPCGRLGPQVAGWREALAPVDVRAVVIGDPEVLGALPYLDDTTWFDPHAVALDLLGQGSPSAVLLGTDGLLAGGPVRGEEAVTAFVDEVRAQVTGGR
jgi:methylamine utilization protein MauE